MDIEMSDQEYQSIAGKASSTLFSDPLIFDSSHRFAGQLHIDQRALKKRNSAGQLQILPYRGRHIEDYPWSTHDSGEHVRVICLLTSWKDVGETYRHGAISTTMEAS